MCSVARKKKLVFFECRLCNDKTVFIRIHRFTIYYSWSASIENAVYLRCKSMHENYVKLYGSKILWTHLVYFMLPGNKLVFNYGWTSVTQHTILEQSWAYLPTLPVFPGVSDLPVSWLEHQISQEIPTMAFFNFFFINFVILEISKKENKTRGGFSTLIWAVLDWKMYNRTSSLVRNQPIKLNNTW